ncbi:Hypothetical protein NTJ_13352 [Nesidiocoris tenuis]|uniref:Uncharacterized protein n=1 Tax=Nesidiocoris tenuis TaxID=355587 RepID=A0ABN7B817_9HEMI|nr:Hypothetical protein NTJ_13352 [Nesidiocoris tenuis]
MRYPRYSSGSGAGMRHFVFRLLFQIYRDGENFSQKHGGDRPTTLRKTENIDHRIGSDESRRRRTSSTVAAISTGMLETPILSKSRRMIRA